MAAYVYKASPVTGRRIRVSGLTGRRRPTRYTFQISQAGAMKLGQALATCKAGTIEWAIDEGFGLTFVQFRVVPKC